MNRRAFCGALAALLAAPAAALGVRFAPSPTLHRFSQSSHVADEIIRLWRQMPSGSFEMEWFADGPDVYFVPPATMGTA